MDRKINGCQPDSTTIKAEGCCGCHTRKLNTFDYLSDLPKGCNTEAFVEVQFKNTRKGYYLNSLNLDLHKGDMVAVESSPGHDIGQVTLTGKLVERQMKKSKYRHPNNEPRRVYRLAKASDLEKYREVKALEDDTMIRSRKIAESLGLEMKIGDVEYQGDGQKAIFYYIAEGRVDFRQLIKKLAEAFRIRVEMKQIGVRQEAGRIGGIGPCGRQLCCSGWMTNFVSVGTNAARLQDLSLNPYKLAGQCGKLKCCLNYEVDTYFEAQHKVPSRSIELKTKDGNYSFFKNDILGGTVSYLLKTGDRRSQVEPITISNQRAFEIIELNKRGEYPESLLPGEEIKIRETQNNRNLDILANESVTRFDNDKPRSHRRRNDRNRRQGKPQEQDKDKVEKAQRAAKVGNKRRRGHRNEVRNNSSTAEQKSETPNSDSTRKWSRPKHGRAKISGNRRGKENKPEKEQ